MRISTSSPTRPLASGLPALINGSSFVIQAFASASSSAVAPVEMILAIVRSSAWLTALVTSSRVMRVMADILSSTIVLARRPLRRARTLRPDASAMRSQPRRVLGHDPEFDRRQYRDGRADDHMHGHRGGSLEAQYPWRNQCPQSDDEVEPFLPDGECRKRRDREDRDGETGDIGVFRGAPGAESEYPGRKEQNGAQ